LKIGRLLSQPGNPKRKWSLAAEAAWLH